METWIHTADAAAILDTVASNLSQYSSRLEHVCLRQGRVLPKPEGRPYWTPRKTPLLWPEATIRQAAQVRESEPGIGVAAAIERVAGKRPLRDWERRWVALRGTDDGSRAAA